MIRWAIDHGFGVIDINIPQHITEDTPGLERSYEMTDLERRKALTEKLSFYIWENYIEVNDHEHVFMMGIGNAFYGISRLLTQKDTVYQNTSGIVSFVADNALLPIKNTDNPWLQKWYYDNSIVFIAPSHQAWSQQAERKVSKRYGNMKKSTEDRMPEMLQTHRREVYEFLAERAEIELDNEIAEEETGNETEDDEAGEEHELLKDPKEEQEEDGESVVETRGRQTGTTPPTTSNTISDPQPAATIAPVTTISAVLNNDPPTSNPTPNPMSIVTDTTMAEPSD